MSSLSIAAIQLPWETPPADCLQRMQANFEEAHHYLEAAGKAGADIACLGETFNVVGVEKTAENLRRCADRAFDSVMAQFAPVARKYQMAIIAPLLTRVDNELRNLALVLDPEGMPLGSYNKVHCTEEERDRGVVPGNDWPVFKIQGAQVGIQICHDNSFPESARCLTLAGAEIVFWPHLMSGWGGEFMDILLRSPAIHNGIYHVPVAYGCRPDRAWRPGMNIGRSSIIGPDATILADAGRHTGIAQAKVNLGSPRLAHHFTRPGDFLWKQDMLRDRRPETYSVLGQAHPDPNPIPASESSPPENS